MMNPTKAIIPTILVVLCIVGSHGSAIARTILTSNVSSSGIWTDNLFFTQTNKTDTYGITIAPSLGIEYIDPDVVLGLRYTGVGQIFPDVNGANRFISNLSTYLDLPFLTKNYKGLEIRLLLNFTFTPSLDTFGVIDDTGATLSQPGIGGSAGAESAAVTSGLPGVGGNVGGVPGVGNYGIQVPRTNIFRSLAGFTLRYPWTRSFTVGGFYRNLNTVFTEDAFRNSNINTLQADATYRWFASPATTGNIRYAFQAIFSDIAETIPQNQITLGGNHNFTPTLTLAGRVGVNLIRDEPVTGLANISISQQYEGGTIGLRYNQSVGLAQGFSNDATLTQVGSAFLSHTLGERLIAYAQGSMARNKSLRGNEIDLFSFGAGAGLNMIILEWLSGGLDYTWFRQEKQGGDFGLDGDRTFVTLSLTAFADPIKIFD